MTVEKERKAMSLKVTEDLSVMVIPDSNHEFLIPTKDVALGYGVSETTFRRHKQEHPDDLIEGKHFIHMIQHLNASGNQCITPYYRTFWTKRGVIRMGFFIKSGRAKLFRDWTEDLIMNKTDKQAEALNELVQRVIAIVGSQNKAAAHIGVNVATLWNLRNNPERVSLEMRKTIADRCNNIIKNGMPLDFDTCNLIMQVTNDDVRLALWNKLQGGAL